MTSPLFYKLSRLQNLFFRLGDPEARKMEIERIRNLCLSLSELVSVGLQERFVITSLFSLKFINEM